MTEMFKGWNRVMLVSATEMINKAHEGHYAIGAFNINNLEWTKLS